MSSLPDTQTLITYLNAGEEDKAKQELQRIAQELPDEKTARTVALTAVAYDVKTALNNLHADALESILEAIQDVDDLSKILQIHESETKESTDE